MKVTEPIIIATNKDGKRILIKRPSKEFAAISTYQEAFAAEAKQSESLTHPNLLRYQGLEKDEEGVYITFEFIAALPMNRALLDAILHINTPSESKKIMNQLMDAVAYLHAQNICHLNIRPENIFITKSAHDVLLANPANTYVNCTPSFFVYKERYTAPELFSEESIPTPACDIFALGKVMEYLYSYSNMSYGVSRIISKATHLNPSKRFASVGEMKKAFNNARYYNWGMTAIKGVATLAVLALIYHGLSDEPVSTETMHFIEQSTQKAEADKIEAAGKHAEEVYGVSIPSDTARVRQLPTDTLGFNEEEHRKLAEQIFKNEFRKRAEKVIATIYTPQKMNASKETFQQESMDGFGQLDKIQKELAVQFNMDPILTTRLSSEIISELTTESMKKLNKMGDGD